MADVSFENRVVIVTGAGNGLGKAYALELGKRGAKLLSMTWEVLLMVLDLVILLLMML